MTTITLKYFGKNPENLFGDDYWIAIIHGEDFIGSYHRCVTKVFNEFGVDDVLEVHQPGGNAITMEFAQFLRWYFNGGNADVNFGRLSARGFHRLKQ